MIVNEETKLARMMSHEIQDGNEDWNRPCDYWCSQGYPHPHDFSKRFLEIAKQ